MPLTIFFSWTLVIQFVHKRSQNLKESKENCKRSKPSVETEEVVIMLNLLNCEVLWLVGASFKMIILCLEIFVSSLWGSVQQYLSAMWWTPPWLQLWRRGIGVFVLLTQTFFTGMLSFFGEVNCFIMVIRGSSFEVALREVLASHAWVVSQLFFGNPQWDWLQLPCLPQLEQWNET